MLTPAEGAAGRRESDNNVVKRVLYNVVKRR
jgi:hypothetical protein